MMEVLFIVLIVIGVIAVIDPIAYLFLKRRLENKPDSDRSVNFDILETVYGHGRDRWAVPVSLIIGIGFIIAGIILSVG